MKRLPTIAVLVLGATTLLVGQTNNVSVYTLKDVAGRLPLKPTGPNNVSLIGPEAVVVDSKGNTYVADTLGHHVYKVDTNGNVTTVMGNGSAPSCLNTSGVACVASINGKAANTLQIGEVSGLAVDAKDNLYVSDRLLNRVLKIDGTGVVTLVAAGAGNGRFDGDGALATQSDLNGPRGIAFGPDGNLYIADTGNQRIRKVNTTTGIITTVAGSSASGSATGAAFGGDGGPAALARLSSPWGVALDSFGNLFIADTGNNRIRMVATNVSGGVDGTGIITTIAGRDLTAAETATGVKAPYTTGTNGTTGACNKPTGGSNVPACISIGDGGVPTNAILAGPSQIVIDKSNNIYITDSNDNRIRELVANTPQSGTNSSAGYSMIVTIIGTGSAGSAGDGVSAKTATINKPTGIALDANGRLFFTDLGNNRVRLLDPTLGVVQAYAGYPSYNGDQAALQTQLNNPSGVAVDSAGNIYFADSGNNIIRKIDASNNVTTIAGSATGSGDAASEGISPLAAKLNNPTGVAVDGNGFIYFADNGSNRIRKIAANQITTVAGCVFTKITTSSALAQNCTFTSDGLPATILKLSLGGATTQNTKSMAGVAVDNAGNVYFSESGNQVVRKIQADGTIVTVAGQYGKSGSGGDGGPASDLWLSSPEGVAIDNNGVLFVADTANFVIHEITPGGLALPIAGEIGASNNTSETGDNANGVPAPAFELRFRAIEGVAVDNLGNLFFSDTSNNRIARIPYAAPAACTINGQLASTNWPVAAAPTQCTANNLPGVAYRVAGSVAAFTNGDFMYNYAAPTSATAAASTAQLSFPVGIAVDSKGDVIFADQANNLIREAVPPAPSK